MQNTTEKSSRSAEGLYKFFIYFVLVLLAVTIIAVSYTHLDVYKRQAQCIGGEGFFKIGIAVGRVVEAGDGFVEGEIGRAHV